MDNGQWIMEEVEMNGNRVKELSFAFALRIIKLCHLLEQEKKAYVLSRQILKSGTSIGALVREAEHAESKADFIHKMAIALKEANETEYWPELLYQSQLHEKKAFDSIKQDVVELLKLLITIVKSSKQTHVDSH